MRTVHMLRLAAQASRDLCVARPWANMWAIPGHAPQLSPQHLRGLYPNNSYTSLHDRNATAIKWCTNPALSGDAPGFPPLAPHFTLRQLFPAEHIERFPHEYSLPQCLKWLMLIQCGHLILFLGGHSQTAIPSPLRTQNEFTHGSLQYLSFSSQSMLFFFLPPQHPKTPAALLALYDRNWQWEDKFKSALYLGAQLETNEAWLFSTLGAMSPLTPFALACAQHSSSHPIAYQHGCTGKISHFFITMCINRFCFLHVEQILSFPLPQSSPPLSHSTSQFLQLPFYRNSSVFWSKLGLEQSDGGSKGPDRKKACGRTVQTHCHAHNTASTSASLT